MIVNNLKTNGITNPMGFELDKFSLSWITEKGTSYSTFHEAARIEISLDRDFKNILFDSGKKDDINSLAYTPNFNLEPRTRYYWRVTVWGDKGDMTTSEVVWFETGKLDEQWNASWITPDLDKNVHPIIRREFKLSDEVTSARIYISGLGVYNFEINGQRVGNEYLTPGYNAYDYWIQYQTYDVTNCLKQGNNVIGVSLGNGWYKGRFGFQEGGYEELYGDRFAVIAELVVTLKNGSTIVVGSDESWKSFVSPIEFSGIYDGEVYNSTNEIANWSKPGFDDSDWYGVNKTDIKTEKFQARLSLPVIIKEERKPVEVIITPAGETVLDLGQNMTGWIRFIARVPKGQKLTLQYGEVLQNGCFYNDNLRTAKAEYTYISDGKEREIQPNFTFYGFRYVKLIGFPQDINVDDFTGCVLYSDLEEIGSIETSNKSLNKLFSNSVWGQKGNFLEVPTDCPQRDERMGWTGDAQVFSSTACFNMYSKAFYKKFMYDLREEQIRLGGSVPFIVPSFKVKDAFDLAQSDGSSAWGDAATIIPWNLYLHYGDRDLLSDQFNSMREWVDYIKKIDDETGGKRLWLEGFHFGDWVALDGKDPEGFMGGTDPYYVASAYYYYSTQLVAKAAQVLGKDELASHYHGLAAEIKHAINQEYFTPSGKSTISTQTAMILALYMDLINEENRARIIEDLKNKLIEDGVHLKTGFVGTPYLCNVLSENGLNELAYTLVLNNDYPSWLYAVELGATTIWERWNSILPDGNMSETGMNSLNHYAYGSISEWMYRHMCGINPVEESPGFKKIRFEPKPDGQLTYARAELNSASGLIESGWELSKDGSIRFTFAVPFDTRAEAILPNADLTKITVNGGTIRTTDLYARQVEKQVICDLEPGYYVFEYQTENNYQKTYTSSSSIRDLMETNKTREILNEVFPGLVEVPFTLKYVEEPIKQLAVKPFTSMFITQDKIRELDKKLSSL